MTEHWFWAVMLTAVIVWYSTITLKIAIRGSLDIRSMLKRLKERDEESNSN